MSKTTAFTVLAIITTCDSGREERKIVMGRECFEEVGLLQHIEQTLQLSREFAAADKFNDKFSASLSCKYDGARKKKRSLTNRFSTQFVRSKLFSNLPPFQNFFSTKSSPKPVTSKKKELRNNGKEIENFKISGFPSLEEIRANIENTTNENWKRLKNGLLPTFSHLKKGLVSKKEAAEMISERALEKVMKLKTILQNETESQMWQIQNKIDEFTSFQVSVISSLTHFLQKKSPSDEIKQLKSLLEDPNQLLRHAMENFKFLKDLEIVPSALEKDEIFNQVPSLPKFKDFLNTNSKKSGVSEETFMRLVNVKNIFAELETKTREIPFLQDTLNNTKVFLKALLPLREIEEDVEKVVEILKDNKTSLQYKVFNAETEDLERFHLYNHLVNATETVKDMTLPWLPSVRDIARISAPEIPTILKSIFQSDNSSVREEEQELGVNKEEQRPEDDDDDEVSSLEIPNLAGIREIAEILADPGPLPDVENLVTVSKIIPRLIPFVIADYKEEVAGWLEGTEVRDTDLAEVHETLVTWHHQLEEIKKSGLVPGVVDRVVGVIQENNLGLLTTILHLMVRAAEADGSVRLTRQDLQRLDEYLLRPEQVFPVLNDYII